MPPNNLYTSKPCGFCGMRYHTEDKCFKRKDAIRALRKQQGKQREADGATRHTEFAGHSSNSQSDLRNPTVDWIIDTGATCHMTPHKHWFNKYTPNRTPVRLANDHIIYSSGIGTVCFQPLINGKPGKLLEFSRVLHVPELKSNLLSALYLTREKSYVVTLLAETILFKRHNTLLFTASVTPHYSAKLDGEVICCSALAAATTTFPMDFALWHRRFAHLHHAAVQQMHKKQLVKGMVVKSPHLPSALCEPCLAGKQHRSNVSRLASSRSTAPLQLIHSDVHGPLPVQSRHAYKYWITFIDDYSRHLAVLPLKKKSDAFAAFKQYKAYAENQLGRRIKALRDDKGGEYMSKDWSALCQAEGIHRQHTLRDEPHQNGVAERANRTISEGITAMLNEAYLPATFWWDAVAAFVHTHNRSLTSANKSTTPFELWNKCKPDVSHLRVFGCTAYVHIKKDKRKQLQSHSAKCVFIGYPANYKGWLFWNPTTKKEIISDSAVFNEQNFPGTSTTPVDLSVQIPHSADVPEQGGVDFNDDDVLPPPAAPEHHPHIPSSASPSPAPSTASSPAHSPSPSPPPAPRPAPAPSAAKRQLSPASSPPPEPPIKRSKAEEVRQPSVYAPKPRPFTGVWDQMINPLMHYPGRRIPRPPPSPQPPINFQPREHTAETESEKDPLDIMSEDELLAQVDDCYLTFEDAFDCMLYCSNRFEQAFSTSPEPYQWRDIKGRPDAKLWEQAATEEFMSLIENGTFVPVKLPPGRKSIGCRWVFKLKRKADGSIDRYKARLVAKGYSQRPGLEYSQVFAPTAKWSALRAILAIAALEDLELYSLDVSTAFLNGEMDCDVYMQQPEGFEDHFGPDLVLKLIKSLYGLKQAGRQWHKKLDSVLKSLSFTLVQCDNSIWVYKKHNTRIIIPVYVDDMTIACKDPKEYLHIKDELAKHFKLHDLGPTSFLLGVHIQRDRAKHTLTISQKQYITDVLERFGLGTCSTVSTPLPEGHKLSKDMSPKTPEEMAEMKGIPYSPLVGALMYLAVATRPDIAYSVGVLARFSANPGIAHWKAVKHLCRYLQGTKDFKLTYAPDPTGKDLFTAYCDADHGGNPDNGKSTSGMVVKMGTGAISWSSKLQSIVTLSTTEAEYISAVSAGQEILWLRNLFTEFGYNFKSATKLCIDNQSAMSVAKNPEHHGRMKHLDLRYYWLRETVESGQIDVVYLQTKNMPADIMTKALGKVKVQEMCQMLGLRKDTS